MTDKPTTDRKIGALDSCLIVNRVISFLCDRYEDVVDLADLCKKCTIEFNKWLKEKEE